MKKVPNIGSIERPYASANLEYLVNKIEYLGKRVIFFAPYVTFIHNEAALRNLTHAAKNTSQKQSKNCSSSIHEDSLSCNKIRRL